MSGIEDRGVADLRGDDCLAEALRRDLVDVLARRGLDGLGVVVVVRDGRVRVGGTVRARADREAVWSAVRSLRDLRRVEDELIVQP